MDVIWQRKTAFPWQTLRCDRWRVSTRSSRYVKINHVVVPARIGGTISFFNDQVITVIWNLVTRAGNQYSQSSEFTCYTLINALIAVTQEGWWRARELSHETRHASLVMTTLYSGTARAGSTQSHGWREFGHWGDLVLAVLLRVH